MYLKCPVIGLGLTCYCFMIFQIDFAPIGILIVGAQSVIGCCVYECMNKLFLFVVIIRYSAILQFVGYRYYGV